MPLKNGLKFPVVKTFVAVAANCALETTVAGLMKPFVDGICPAMLLLTAIVKFVAAAPFKSIFAFSTLEISITYGMPAFVTATCAAAESPANGRFVPPPKFSGVETCADTLVSVALGGCAFVAGPPEPVVSIYVVDPETRNDTLLPAP